MTTSATTPSLHFFDDLAATLHGAPPLPVGIIYPCSAVSLRAACELLRRGLAQPVLIGPAARIREIAREESLDITACRIVEAIDDAQAAQRGVRMARDGEVAVLMKGALHSRVYLHEIGHHESGLRTDRWMSHVYILDLPGVGRPLLVSDGAVNIAPDLDVRRDIVRNAIDLAHMLGIACPRVALLSAVETVNPGLQSTLDAAIICKMADRGQITGGIVDGPLAFDNALSPEAARCKGVHSPIGGQADILIVPDLEAGNILAKQMTFLGGAQAAGIVLGARVPVILTSRADSLSTRVLSCMVAISMIRNGYRIAGPGVDAA
ncbi:bifunctional enoyl-CoA hydratase/phosphate acetyltransferase [Novacetimonas cocois]|uniref:Phosphate acetyltransferase n=1 Tax=Novacetimonas cocois TaxID=1747507 RepID=A0A365Z096_9PROT|nr:bifunctional enoyl-CoA hydratase/phosphate acetyltransferase [Novacetimonas cocois]RBM09315.1 phosphate acetyltransferase [Novacetimonas cocois]